MGARLSFTALAVTTLASAGALQGAIVPFAGTLATTPTFNRPSSLTALSGAGTAVGYTPVSFTVDTTGGYTITQVTPTYDGFLLLYTGSFLPATPLVNLINGDDDFDPEGACALGIAAGSRILATGGTASGVANFAATNTLTTGTTYVLVATSFANGLSGAFTGTIDGPGTVTVVPEPTSLALLGLGGLALLRRRSAK